MPNWRDILEEVKASGSVHDVVRRKYISELAAHTQRNVIVYYSGWLQKSEIVGSGFTGFSVNDGDKNGFMATIHGLDRTKGLDLILHTPGGDTAATESLVDYLRSMFGTDIRAIVPQLAMSAGTLIALACKQIVMGKHSSLGPIDPQFSGIPAHGVIEEFQKAYDDVTNNPASIPVWQPVIAKYPPAFIGECQKAIDWSKQMATDWLENGMFAGDADAAAKTKRVVDELADHAITLSHNRHYSLAAIQGLGLNVFSLETAGHEELQDKVLTVHHACIQTLSSTPCYKLIENNHGVGYIQMLTQSLLQP